MSVTTYPVQLNLSKPAMITIGTAMVHGMIRECDRLRAFHVNPSDADGPIRGARGAMIYAMENVWYDSFSNSSRAKWGYKLEAWSHACGWTRMSDLDRTMAERDACPANQNGTSLAPCDFCKGSGKRHGLVCVDCYGAGWIVPIDVARARAGSDDPKLDATAAYDADAATVEERAALARGWART